MLRSPARRSAIVQRNGGKCTLPQITQSLGDHSAYRPAVLQSSIVRASPIGVRAPLRVRSPREGRTLSVYDVRAVTRTLKYLWKSSGPGGGAIIQT